MNYIKLLLLLVLVHGYPSCSMAQTFNKMVEANYVSNISFETNLIKNPSARAHNGFVSVTNATATRDTSAGNKIDQTASFSVDASAQNGYAEWALNPESDEQTSGNCGFSGIFKGDGTLYKAQILDGSNNVLAQTVTLTNETGWREFKVWHPCGASGARKVRITQTDAGTAPAINVGKLFYGRMEPGAGVPPNTFTAKVSATGIVSNVTPPGWLTNFSVTDIEFTGTTFKSGLFTQTPNCIAVVDTSSGTGFTYSIRTYNTTTSTIGVSSNSVNATTAAPFTISCTKTGADYIQPAITPAQWDYDWKDYTQSIVAESGTFPTYTLNLMQQARFAGKLYLKGKLTMTGTNTWSDIRIPVPTGLQILTSVIAPSEINYFDAGSNFYAGSPISMNASYIRIGSKSGTNGQGLIVTQTSPFTWASGDTVEWFIGPMDVVGWTNSSAAPQLVGSVTSDFNGALRIEHATVSSTGVVSLESSDWINGNAVVTDTSSFTLTKNGGAGLTNCWSTVIGTPSSTASSSTASADSTVVTVRTYTNNTYAAQQFKVFCIGPR